MMLLIPAWICHANENLRLTKWLCADDEPKIWLLLDDTIAL
ncbi:MAG: YaeQ family protein [Candidatus Malihini olakiniferum]